MLPKGSTKGFELALFTAYGLFSMFKIFFKPRKLLIGSLKSGWIFFLHLYKFQTVVKPELSPECDQKKRTSLLQTDSLNWGNKDFFDSVILK